MHRVVIIGGGISGLTLAYRLLQLNSTLSITVLEKESRSGGKVVTTRQEGYLIEGGPNGFLDSSPATLSLCRELGLDAELIEANPSAAGNRFVFLKGRLRRLPSSLIGFLGTRVLSWRAKAQVALERFKRTPSKFPDESIAEFFARRVGREIADGLADAFVTGIYAGDPKLLSMRACFPRLVALEEEYGSILGGMRARARKAGSQANVGGPRTSGRLWSLRGGLGQLISRLRERLHPMLVEDVSVEEIQSTPGAQNAWRIIARQGRNWAADAVILTCPAPQQSALLAPFDSSLAQELGAIAYNRVAVVALGYRQEDVPFSLDGFGFLIPQAARRDLLGVQWCSSLFPDRAPAGHVLLRALCGGWHRGEMVDWDDCRLKDAVNSELKATMGIKALPAFQRIIRWPAAIPQYFVGHLDRMNRIEALVKARPGLFLGGNAFGGVALNDCTFRAGELAARIQSYLQAQNPAST